MTIHHDSSSFIIIHDVSWYFMMISPHHPHPIQHQVGAMDQLASRCRVGPKVHSCCHLGMVMDFLPGDILQEATDQGFPGSPGTQEPRDPPPAVGDDPPGKP